MKRTWTAIAIFTLAFCHIDGYAQFNKFKSRTKFNKNKSNNSRSSLLNKAVDDGEATFGRDATESAKPSDTDKKYVNLNPETAFGPEVVVSFDFEKTKLEDLTKYMQKLTGINLIIDSKQMKGEITISAPTPITVGEAWKAYLTALNTNGYTLVKSGAFYKIVQSREVRYTPTKIYTGNYTPDTDNYVMRILPLKNINAKEVTRSFRPYMSRYGRIIDIPQTNTIIIQDTGSNVNRLVRMIRIIDVPGHDERLQIIAMKHSSAQEIAKLLDQILKGATGKFKRNATKKSGQNISKIIAEPRTNSIIAMANSDGAKQLRNLIKKLDVAGVATTGGRIHVYYLNHGDAETLSKTLSTLVGSSSSSSRRSSRFSRKSSSTVSSGGTTLFNSDVKITADKSNNALVITASPTDYLTIKTVIDKLDIPKDQVYVEGLIMETIVSKNRRMGISIMGAYGKGAASKAGFTGGSSDLVNLLSNNVTTLSSLFVGGGIGNVVEQDLGNGQKIQINTVNALISAVATHANTNVLATPQIMAMDNTEAVFEVGETVPIPERTNASNGSSSVAIKQQKVTLKIKITPQINKVTRMVKLKVEKNIEDFSSRRVENVEGVGTTLRSGITTVNVRDRDTVAMGGLMRDKEIDSQSKVPLLGDVPVLGWLFRNTTSVVEKVNLLIFLTPKIISHSSDAAETTKDVLNRRAHHLKNVVGEDDPFKTTTKGLYEKAKKQENGPLFDQEKSRRYRDTNENHEGVSEVDRDELKDLIGDTPEYRKIIQKVRRENAGRKKK
jgi:general secretion pathway protein D